MQLTIYPISFSDLDGRIQNEIKCILNKKFWETAEKKLKESQDKEHTTEDVLNEIVCDYINDNLGVIARIKI